MRHATARFTCRNGQRFAEKTALIFPSQNISFGALYLQSRQVAARLQKLGIGPGARVAIVHENALAAVVFFWGILASGAQVVDVPCLAGVETIDEILAECKPATIVLSAHQCQRLMRTGAKSLPEIVLMETPSPITPDARSCHSLAEIVASESSDGTLPHMHDSSVALIIYTSGTTGRPKGVMLSHRNLLTNVAAANSRVGVTCDDSILVVVPLSFIHGRMQLLTHAMVGGTMAFSEGFHFPQQVIQELAKYRVTGFSGTPYHFYTLLERTNMGASRLPELRYVLVTGGAMRPEGLIRLSKALPGWRFMWLTARQKLHQGSLILGRWRYSAILNRAAGRYPEFWCKSWGRTVREMPPGTVGEVVASGPNSCAVMSPETRISSQKIDSFGRLHTGDMGRIRSHGHLYLAGENPSSSSLPESVFFPAKWKPFSICIRLFSSQQCLESRSHSWGEDRGMRRVETRRND